jgi:hypothetical protein
MNFPIMNFLVFQPYAFIVSKKNCLPHFELIEDKAALKVRYPSTIIAIFIWRQSHPHIKSYIVFWSQRPQLNLIAQDIIVQYINYKILAF